MTASPALTLEKANFPIDPFGYTHATKTADIAERVGAFLGLKGDELQLCRHVALFHDLGRRAPWWEKDPDCARRSAEAAMIVLKDNPDWFARPDMVARAGRIIAAHSLDRETLPDTIAVEGDKIAIALWDADSLECARFDPNGARGRELVARRYKRLLSAWAELPEHQERVLKAYRGA